MKKIKEFNEEVISVSWIFQAFTYDSDEHVLELRGMESGNPNLQKIRNEALRKSLNTEIEFNYYTIFFETI